ncbi:MAG TPA: alpha/beta fold hydrolase [Stellaceae bacterium]|nr:alpha/beta fold hydrolase [Stellaceae bacterium]
MLKRRCFIAFAVAVALALLVSVARADEKSMPILFIHGNGDNAAVWMTTMWRFETNGYPRQLMEAVELRYPLAAAVYDQPQPAHSTVAEATAQIADAVSALRHHTGAPKVVLVAHARGGILARQYLKERGAASVAALVLCGAPNHGVLISEKLLVGSEFNGASAFLRALNGPGEVPPGVRVLTIRSDGNDKYAQADGRFIGYPGVATGVDASAPALTGADNVAIARIDHREAAFGPEAFTAMYRFITGRAPRTTQVRRERNPILEGTVSAFEDGAATNIGAAGAVVEVYKVSVQTGERIGNAWLRQVTSEDGHWGPLKAESNAAYEFVVAAPGFPVTHIYRSPFARSSRFVDLRPQLLTKEDRDAGAVVYLSRPRGYLGLERGRIALDGKPPPGIDADVPNLALARLTLAPEPRTVTAQYGRERIALRSWPLRDNQVSVAELTW